MALDDKAGILIGDLVRLEVDGGDPEFAVVIDKGYFSAGLMLCPENAPIRVVEAPLKRIRKAEPMEAPTGRLIAAAQAIRDDHQYNSHF